MPVITNIGSQCTSFGGTYTQQTSTGVYVYAGWLYSSLNAAGTVNTNPPSTLDSYVLFQTTTTAYNSYAGTSLTTGLPMILPIKIKSNSSFPTTSAGVSDVSGTITQNWYSPIITLIAQLNSVLTLPASPPVFTANRIITSGALVTAPAQGTVSTTTASAIQNNIFNYVQLLGNRADSAVAGNEVTRAPYQTMTSSSVNFTPSDLTYIGIPDNGTGTLGTYSVPIIDIDGTVKTAFSSVISAGGEFKSGYFYGFSTAGTINIKYVTSSTLASSFYIQSNNNYFLWYFGGTMYLLNDPSIAFYGTGLSPGASDNGAGLVFTITKNAAGEMIPSGYLQTQQNQPVFSISLVTTPTVAIPNFIVTPTSSGFTISYTGTLPIYGGSTTITITSLTPQSSFLAAPYISSSVITQTSPYNEILLLPQSVSSAADQAQNVLYFTGFAAYPTGTTKQAISFGFTTYSTTMTSPGIGLGYSQFLPVNSGSNYIWTFTPFGTTSEYIISVAGTTLNMELAASGAAAFIATKIPVTGSALSIFDALEGYCWQFYQGTSGFAIGSYGTTIPATAGSAPVSYLKYDYNAASTATKASNTGIVIATSSTTVPLNVPVGPGTTSSCTLFQCRYITSAAGIKAT